MLCHHVAQLLFEQLPNCFLIRRLDQNFLTLCLELINEPILDFQLGIGLISHLNRFSSCVINAHQKRFKGSRQIHLVLNHGPWLLNHCWRANIVQFVGQIS